MPEPGAFSEPAQLRGWSISPVKPRAPLRVQFAGLRDQVWRFATFLTPTLESAGGTTLNNHRPGINGAWHPARSFVAGTAGTGILHFCLPARFLGHAEAAQPDRRLIVYVHRRHGAGTRAARGESSDRSSVSHAGIVIPISSAWCWPISSMNR